MADYVYRAAVGALQGAFKALDLQIKVTGAENVPAAGPVVMATNHVSYLDFVFSGLGVWQGSHRLTRFMAKEAIFRHWLGGPLMRAMDHIPVDRASGKRSYETALAALHRGEVVGVFPEGTTSRSFTVKSLKTGAVRLAQEAPAPLLPVVTWGGQRISSKGRPKDFTTRGRTILIAVGEPFTVPPDADVRTVTDGLRVTLQRMLDTVQAGHPDTARGGLDAWWLPEHLGGTAPTPLDRV